MPVRTSRRHAVVLVTIGVVAASLTAGTGVTRFASADTGSTLANSPFNGSDGVLDTTPANRITTVLDHTGALEEGYTNGAKENDLCPTITLHGSPPKADITSFSVGSTHVGGTTPADFLYLAWGRAVNSGTTTIEFELNQSTAPCAPATPTRSNRVRTDKDLLIVYNFHGGTVDSIQQSTWVAAGGSWSAPLTLTAPVEEAMISADQLFGEVVINLDLLPQFFNPAVCTTLSSAFARSRSSSGAGGEELKDFIPPSTTRISNCGTLVVNKVDNAGAGLAGAVFGLFTDAAATLPASTAGDDRCTTTGGNTTTPATCSFGDVRPGTYYVKEISAPANYTVDSAITQVVAEKNTTTVVSHTYLNSPLPGTITVQKVDDTGAGLAGAVFGLYTDTGATTPAATPAVAGNNQCTTAGGGSTTAATCEFNDVEPGTYYVKELSAPLHYTADATIRQATVSANTSAAVSFTNPRNPGTVALRKVDGNGDGLDGAVFGLFTDANATTPATTTNPTLASYNQCTTSGGGPASPATCGFDDVVPGTYYVKELSPPAHYGADGTVAAVTAVSDQTVTVSHTFVNLHNPGTLEVRKVDDTGAGLDGALFGLFTDANATTPATTGNPVQAANNQCTTAGGTATVTATCAFNGVVPGTYYVKELSPPAHHDLDTTIATATAVAGRTTVVSHTFVNARNPGTIQVDKVDDTNLVGVDGAVFGLFTDPAATTAATTTNPALTANNQCTTTGGDPTTASFCTFNAVVPGTYYVKEISTPAGHALDPTIAPVASVSDVTTSVAHIFVNPRTDPGIKVVETQSADVVHVGDTVTYTFVVTNPGHVPLTSVGVTDPRCDATATLASMAGGNQDAVLDRTETWTFSCTHVVTAADPSPLASPVTAHGTDPLGVVVTSSDTVSLVILHPGIAITKTPDPVSVSPGGTVVFTYVVTNTGDTTLADVTVTDDVLDSIGTVALLQPNASTTFTKSMDVVNGSPNENVGTATGVDPIGKAVTASTKATISVVLADVLTRQLPRDLPRELPRTGASLEGQVRAATALLLSGMLLVVVARRPRRAARRG